MLTQERLKELLHYDPETGVFTWKVGRGGIRKGQPAGTLAGDYIQISVDRQLIRAHRLAWLYMTGAFPKHNVDHENTIGTDNCWTNLRAATHAENGLNRGAQSNNSSGAKNVSRHSGGAWVARIQVGGTYKHLGSFPTIIAAAEAAAAARRQHHGEFANNGSAL